MKDLSELSRRKAAKNFQKRAHDQSKTQKEGSLYVNFTTYVTPEEKNDKKDVKYS